MDLQGERLFSRKAERSADIFLDSKLKRKEALA